MPLRGTRCAVTSLLLAVAAALPAAAQAADPAAATISSCKSDSIVVAGKVRLAGSSARKARGAALQLRFQALPLFGLPHDAAWRSIGKKTKATRQEAFPGLAADNWVGVMSWRYKRGRRTVLSGITRSQPLRIGASKGRANCTIAEGLKPVDKTPPSLFVVPGDDAWHHAPVTVQLIANDDFSGVQSVRYSLDGGPRTAIPNGSSFSIPNQGAHTVGVEATDVAGNTATRTATVRVDGAAPTKPALSRPFSVTASTTPTLTWSASTDSASGMKGYLLTIRRADGSVAGFRTVPPDVTSVPSPAPLSDGQTYTAVVTAVDNTVDPAWTTDSDTLTFRVDSSPDVSSPQDNQILAFGAKKQPVVVNFDRPVDPATKTGATLTRDALGGNPDPHASGPTCSSPCSSISFSPTDSGGFPEGRYTLTVNVKSEEGVPMQKTIRFAVPSPANEYSSAPPAQVCPLVSTEPPFNISTTSDNETVRASFHYELTGGNAQVQLIQTGISYIARADLTPGSGDRTLELPIATHGTYAPRLEYCLTGATGSLTLTDVYASRIP